ncbi:MAG: bis(5'-nucleosyl)-tetraphosphatase (symmetrical) YqeK [Bacillota bacterium]
MDEAYKFLEIYLSAQRRAHSYRVADTARQLSSNHGVDNVKTYLAGLLHDIARDLEKEKILELVKEQQLYRDRIDLEIPVVLHSYVSAWISSEKFGIVDKEVLEAIIDHTLASPEMTDVAKVVYLADLIEPERQFPGIDKIRELASVDLDEAMLYALDITINYLVQTKKLIHPRTIEARNQFLRIHLLKKR